MNTSARRNEHGFLARALIAAGFLLYAASGFAWEVTPNFSWLELLPPGSYMDSWSFEGTNWDSDFGFAPLSCSNIVQIPDWDGNALQVDATNAAWLTYDITENAPRYGEYTNLTLGTGSIEFLFSPNWESADTNYYGSGPSDFGRFIEAGAWETNADSDWWSLYLNPEGTGIYFSSGTNGVRTNYLSAPISWGENWHMIVLTYSPTNTFLYLDGQLATSGAGVCYVPSGAILTNGFAIGSDFATGLQQAHGQFDDLYTYDYQLSANDVSNGYAEVYPELPRSFRFGAGFGPDDEPPGPDGGGSGSGSGSGSYTPPDYGTNLYLTITNAFNNQASGWINNSSIYVPYTVFSRQLLPWPIWSPEATFYGSWQTNLTAFSVPMLARSNLFLEARSEIAPRIIGGGVTQFAALRRDGTVWTWGNSDQGQLGNGQWTNSDAPVQAVGLSNIVAVVAPATGNFDLALDSSGRVWSWGANDYGQLGLDDGLYEDEDTPSAIPGLTNIVAIAGGSGHAIALKSDGTVWAWGDNAYGDLGDNSDEGRDDAEQVLGLTNAIAIASGDCHCFAICANGTVWGWGLNEDWELGIGNANDQWLPVLVTNLTNVIALSGGEWHSIALLANGTIEAWGANYEGEIGDISSSTPVAVPGLSNIVSIASGSVHNLFIDTNGNSYAWGYDGDGEFGDDGADYGDTDPYLLTTVSNVTAVAGGFESSIISIGNGNIYTFGNSYEYESAPTLTDLYTNYSSDGSGLPDWWELMYFHRLGVDTNSDPAGDGWTIWQDYEQGFNPTNFITPPAITGLTV
ncbi:MAG TPA: LamG-like jellyroll fold domain-containing protein, partial [Candidatus Acidoferrum sp.]|nr:LamG-like jellyroll fold domain-containing protein [Candidatus Acidoferrum sp.]